MGAIYDTQIGLTAKHGATQTPDLYDAEHVRSRLTDALVAIAVERR